MTEKGLVLRPDSFFGFTFIFYSNQKLALDPAWPIRLIFIAFTRNSLEIGRVKGRTEGKRREGGFGGKEHATTIFIFNLSQL